MDDVVCSIFRRNFLHHSWLSDDQTFMKMVFSEVKNSFWIFQKSDREEIRKRVKQHTQPLTEPKVCGIWLVCPNGTYMSMFAKTGGKS